METQNNTQVGDIVLPTTSDLTGKEGHLVKIPTGGSLNAALTSAVADVALFVILRVNSPTEVEVRPFTAERSHRVRLNGACTFGSTLILATGGDSGKLAASATGNIKAVAEEVGVDEQLVRVRPVNLTLA